ncbi:hypothetical protein HYV85_01440 [Candidatus Woesearchaeota archaeon]|nr:hypothetical protein [Candidatus Woesearchaeota archaeon]
MSRYSLLKLFTAAAAGATAFAQPVLAHCPLCAAATAGGVAATRFLGVDDSVTGTFIGGFVVSTGLWFNNWLKKKKNGGEFLPFQAAIVVLLSVALTLLTFYMAKLIGSPNPAYMIFGVDKLMVGMLAGTVVSVGAFALHKWIRKVRGGKSLMPFQGIIVTLLCLAATGAVFYFVTK